MQAFDPATGQIYRETTSSLVPSMVPTWLHQSRNKRVNPSLRRDQASKHRKTCSSLQEMALRSCVWNADLFLPETLRGAGWWYAGRLYQRLKDTETLSFHIWSVFHDAFPTEISLNRHFHVRENIGAPLLMQIPSIASRMARLDARVLSFVCVQGYDVNLEHLICLSGISTLGSLVLEIDTRGSMDEIRRDDRVRELRAWTRIVRENNALGKLKVLVFCNFGIEREVVLRCLTDFPALCLVGLGGSGIGGLRHEDGEWRCVVENGQHHEPDSVTEPGPNSIWTRRDITSTNKAELLYTSSFSFQSESATRTEPCPIVAVSYGDTARHVGGSLDWYVRDPRKRNSSAHKRPRDGAVSREGEKGNAGKKRMVRRGRQRDVGDMLGAFSA